MRRADSFTDQCLHALRDQAGNHGFSSEAHKHTCQSLHLHAPLYTLRVAITDSGRLLVQGCFRLNI